MMSLPFLLGETEETLSGKPYLEIKGHPFFVVHYDDPVYLKKDKPRVGICWEGNKENTKDKLRSLPFEVLEPLFMIDEIDLFSLQKGLNVKSQ
jgi:hypothetical protein